ncbi:MAG: aminotransferase class V-fold PLP-dependent enzyme, partial [Phaeodactylibacter sp.]|nr:aminotransferase class V-fold PLP-dependent enzyme [Phaeodactylibacter sp.]
WERSYALQLGAAAALEYPLEVGLEAAATRIQALSRRLREGLSGLPGARVLDKGMELGGIVTVHFEGKDPQSILQALHRHQINAAMTTVHQARIDFEAKQVHWVIRLSPHYYNTEAEVDRTLVVLEGL